VSVPPRYAEAVERQSVTLNATADTYLRHGAPSQSQGDQGFLRVKASGHNRALVRFDQGAIATAVGAGPVLSAMLELNIERNGHMCPSRRRGHQRQR
jgi:hypothetical protein